MPIRPENKARYPANWLTEIRPRILARAGRGDNNWPCCEECGVPNLCWIERATSDARSWSMCMESDGGVKIILTIAHLSEEIEDCSDENLRAWCQMCHNRYDAPMRAAGIKARRRAVMAVGDLFCEEAT
jgi:hypothetical protein